jgi:hypothetical protein
LKKTIIILAIAALALSACSKTTRSQMAIAMTDRPAHITCYTYGVLIVDEDTSGKIEFDSTGRIDFIEAKTGDSVKTEGDCKVRYKVR